MRVRAMKKLIYLLMLLIVVCSVSAASLNNRDLFVNAIMIGDYGVTSVYDDVIPVRVSITNNHDSKIMEDLRIKIEIPELDKVYYTHSFDVRPDTRDTRWLFIDLPYYANSGDYLIKITVSNDKIKRIKYRYLWII